MNEEQLREENRILHKQIKKLFLVCENLEETCKLREELYNDEKKDNSQSGLIVGRRIVCLILGVLIGMHIGISFWN